METKNTTTYNTAGGSAPITIINGKQSAENAAIQVVSDGIYDGTTATITIEESNDGTNWNEIESGGVVLQLPINAPSDTFMLKTTIFLGDFIRAAFVAGDATQGVLTIITKLKE